MRCSDNSLHLFVMISPSVHWRCWLGGRKGIRPVKNWVVGCWHGYLSGVRCRFACGPADATATHYLLLQQIQIGFTFLVPAYPGSPGQNLESRKIVVVVIVVVVGHTCAACQKKLSHILNVGCTWAQLKVAKFQSIWDNEAEYSTISVW